MKRFAVFGGLIGSSLFGAGQASLAHLTRKPAILRARPAVVLSLPPTELTELPPDLFVPPSVFSPFFRILSYVARCVEQESEPVAALVVR